MGSLSRRRGEVSTKLCPVDELDEAEQRARATKLAQWREFIGQLRDEAVDLSWQISSRDALSELRDRLYEEPSSDLWEELVTIFSHWPAEGVQDAIDYALPHLTRWPEGGRVAPVHWLASVLREGSEEALYANETGLTVAKRPTPLLRLCDALVFHGTKLRAEDVSCLTKSKRHHDHIEHVIFWEGRIYAKADIAFQKSSLWPHLRVWAAHHTSMRDAGPTWLARSLAFRPLEVLEWGAGVAIAVDAAKVLHQNEVWQSSCRHFSVTSYWGEPLRPLFLSESMLGLVTLNIDFKGARLSNEGRVASIRNWLLPWLGSPASASLQRLSVPTRYVEMVQQALVSRAPGSPAVEVSDTHFVSDVVQRAIFSWP